MRRRRPVLCAAGLVAVVLTLAFPASVGTAAQNGAWRALRQPGVIAIMRHALAPGTGDPAGFDLDDCSTQRNLNDAGRAQARAIGEAFRANGVRVDRVLTSQWCRCKDTARLLNLAPVEEFPPLNSFFADRSTADTQTRRTRAFLADLPPERMVVLVTHQVNVTALTGVYPRSGEVLAVQVANDGGTRVVGRVRMESDE